MGARHHVAWIAYAVTSGDQWHEVYATKAQAERRASLYGGGVVRVVMKELQRFN